MLGRWHATASLQLIICCALQFSMHKASIEVKGTSVNLEFFHKALNFTVEKLLFLGDHAVAGVASAVVVFAGQSLVQGVAARLLDQPTSAVQVETE